MSVREGLHTGIVIEEAKNLKDFDGKLRHMQSIISKLVSRYGHDANIRAVSIHGHVFFLLEGPE